MTLCLTCRNECCCVEPNLRKIRGGCEYYRPITNADQIRAMTDEELAQFLDLVRGNSAYPVYYTDWRDWLKHGAT